MIEINYDIKQRLSDRDPSGSRRVQGGRFIDERCADTAFFVTTVIRDMLTDLRSMMDPDDFEKVYNAIKRGDLL